MSDDFSQFIEMYLVDILYLAISGIRLMSQQAFVCMEEIAAAPQNGYPKILGQLFSNATGKNKHKMHKKGCLQFLHFSFKLWSTDCLERHVTGFAKVIKTCLAGKDPTEREEVRSDHIYSNTP